MWPIVTDKCLIPFLGRPLLYHNLKKIVGNTKALEFIIVANSKSKEAIVKIAKSLSINFQVVLQSESKGMADAILSAKELIEGKI